MTGNNPIFISLDKEIAALYSGTDIQKDYKQRRDAMQSAINDRKELRNAISKAETQGETIQTYLSSLSLKSPGCSAAPRLLRNP